MTPDEVAARAMDALVSRLSILVMSCAPCGECTACLESDRSLKELHRLAALYPDAVPRFAPKSVLDAVKAARR